MKKQLKENHLERSLFYIGLAVLPCVCLVYRLYLTVLRPLWPFDGCIWDVFWGIYCPGCGGTRAIESLCKGNILSALWYHPAVVYCVSIYSVYMLSNLFSFVSKGRIKGIRFHNWFLYLALVIIILNFLAKNYLRIRHGIIL